MLNLFVADLKRILKDKLLIAIILCCIGFAIFTPALNKGLEFIYTDILEMEEGLGIYAITVIPTAFAPLGDFGLIISILMVIIIRKDFNYGTIRNKIIAGNSRFKIYLSTSLASAVFVCITMLIYSIIMLLFSTMMFDFAPSGEMSKAVPYAILTILFGVLFYFCITAILMFMSLIFKNSAISIIIYIVLLFVVQIVLGIAVGVSEGLTQEGGYKGIVNFIDFLCKCNPYYLQAYVFPADIEYYKSDIVACILTPIVWSVVVSAFGFIIFRKKDLK